jgi:hypothetical protein
MSSPVTILILVQGKCHSGQRSTANCAENLGASGVGTVISSQIGHNRLNTVLILILGALFAGLAQGQIFVVNQGSGTIGEYTLSGTTINASLISGLQSPTGMAISGSYLYVAQENGTLKEYTTSGKLVNPALITGLYLPWGVAVSGDYLYVANAGGESSTVGKYTTSGVAVNASLISGLGNPTGLALEGDHLYVSEWHNGRVGVYTTSGAILNASLISGLTYPGGLALDGNGHLFVSTFGRVGEYSTSGEPVNGGLIFGGHNSGVGLALDGNGDLFWANNYGGAGGNIIAEYTTSGQTVNSSLITGLQNPVAIVVVPEPSSQVLLVLAATLIIYKGVKGRRCRLTAGTRAPNTALEPLEQLGEIAKGISPCIVGRKVEGQVRRAARESTGLIMKRPERIVSLKAAPFLRFGAARVSAHGHRSASPACRSCGAGRCRRASPESFRGCGSVWTGLEMRPRPSSRLLAGTG